MKGEFYKMDFEAWDEGTVDLPLEVEAAYLRLCHQMYRSGGPIPNSIKLLQGLFRCGHTRAAALLRQLIEAGKVHVREDGRLTNQRVTSELANREQLATKRRAAGHQGGTNSGASRSNPLKDNDAAEANASASRSREEERREDSPKAPKGAEPEGFAEFWAAYPKRRGDNPRKTALPAYVAALRRGATHSAIMNGLRRYVAELTEDGKIGTQFVALAATWLNQDRFERPAEDATPLAGRELSEGDYLSRLSAEEWRQHVGRWRSTGGHWILTSRTPPPDDRRTRVPPAILAEFGIRHGEDVRAAPSLTGTG